MKPKDKPIITLSPQEESLFRSWYNRTSKLLGLNPDPDDPSQYYDYRSFWKEYGAVPMEESQHFPDTYKLPGHPTFSNESIYYNKYNKDMGGHWGNGMEIGNDIDNYIPHRKDQNMKFAYGGNTSPIRKKLRKFSGLQLDDKGNVVNPSIFGDMPEINASQNVFSDNTNNTNVDWLKAFTDLTTSQKSDNNIINTVEGVTNIANALTKDSSGVGKVVSGVSEALPIISLANTAQGVVSNLWGDYNVAGNYWEGGKQGQTGDIAAAVEDINPLNFMDDWNTLANMGSHKNMAGKSKDEKALYSMQIVDLLTGGGSSWVTGGMENRIKRDIYEDEQKELAAQRERDKINALKPYYHMKSRLYGKGYDRSPGFAYGGAIGDPPKGFLIPSEQDDGFGGTTINYKLPNYTSSNYLKPERVFADTRVVQNDDGSFEERIPNKNDISKDIRNQIINNAISKYPLPKEINEYQELESSGRRNLEWDKVRNSYIKYKYGGAIDDIPVELVKRSSPYSDTIKAEQEYLSTLTDTIPNKTIDQYLINRLMNEGGLTEAEAIAKATALTTPMPHYPKFAFGGLSMNNLPKENSMQISPNAELVLNDQGGTQGSHETGQEIPINNENGIAGTTEPGEVVVDINGAKVVLSKRLGFAQKYEELNGRKEQLLMEFKKSNDQYKKNALRRHIDEVTKSINSLPIEQEEVRQSMGLNQSPEGTPQFSYGNIGDPEEDYLTLLQKAKFDPNKYAMEDIGEEVILPKKPVYLPDGTLAYEIPDENFVGKTTKDFVERPNTNALNFTPPADTRYTELKPSDFKEGDLTPKYKYRKGKGEYAGTLQPDGEFEGDSGSGRGRINTQTVKDILDFTVPFADNLINAQITKNRPDVPEPTMDTFLPVNEDVNFNAYKRTLNEQRKNALNSIKLNSNNPQDAANMMNKLNMQYDNALATIEERENLQENQLKNLNVQGINETNARNNAKIDSANWNKMLKVIGQQDELSANVSNAMDDVYNMLTRSDQKEYQALQLSLMEYAQRDTNVMLGMAGDQRFDQITRQIINSKESFDTMYESLKSSGAAEGRIKNLEEFGKRNGYLK